MEREDFAALAAKIVAAYVGNNTIAQEELPGLLARVSRVLADISEGLDEPVEVPTGFKTAVAISKSITSDYLVCLEDGTRFKSLKRHLRVNHGLTPAEYREKWGLPADYPMVAPSYRRTRSRIAKSMSFGRRKSTRTRKK